MKKENIPLKMQAELVYGEKAKLDSKDAQIIRVLYKDARMSFSDIAKEVKLSRDAVRYRVEKLIAADVIQGFFPLLNPPKIGFPIITIVYLSFQNIDPETEKRFIQAMKGNKFVSNFASVTGRWDYFLIISSRDLGHFNDILKEIRGQFSGIIKEYEISNVIQTYKASMYNNLLE